MKKILFALCFLFFAFSMVTYSKNTINNNTQLIAKAIIKIPPTNEELSRIKLPILMYHDVRPDYNGGANTVVSTSQFEADVKAIKKAGFSTVFLSDVTNFVELNESFPQKPLVIIFDDGYESNYKYAFPILKEQGMKANIAIIGSSIGAYSYLPRLTWDEIKEMYKAGTFEFQLHSYDMHKNSSDNPYKGCLEVQGETYDQYTQRLAKDVYKLQSLIKENLKYKPRVYVYPYGFNSEFSERALKYIGIKATVTIESGINNLGNGLYKLKRINREPSYTTDKLIKLLSN